jgi:hypothetical protein
MGDNFTDEAGFDNAGAKGAAPPSPEASARPAGVIEFA